MNTSKFSEALTLELTELKKLGVKVSKKAFAKAKDENEINECIEGGMSVSDAADMFMACYN